MIFQPFGKTFGRPNEKEKFVPKPTLYIEIESPDANNPVAMALRVIFRDSVEILETAVDANGVEADIAIVNTINTALRIIKETERTQIVIACLGAQQEKEAHALAERNSSRMKAAPIVDRDDRENVVFLLMRLIAEATKSEVAP